MTAFVFSTSHFKLHLQYGKAPTFSCRRVLHKRPFLYDSHIPPAPTPSCLNFLAISRPSRGLRREARKIRLTCRPPRTEPYCIVRYRISRYAALHQSLTRFVQKYRGEGRYHTCQHPSPPSAFVRHSPLHTFSAYNSGKEIDQWQPKRQLFPGNRWKLV